MEYELYHHGILGMKWGVRRYQNKDGSLTPAGKIRRKQNEASRNYSEDEKRIQSLSGKKAEELSNQELRIMNERLQLKKQYANLTKKEKNQVLAIRASAVGIVASVYTKRYMTKAVEAIISKLAEVGTDVLYPEVESFYK